jgi:hypothetical protein
MYSAEYEINLIQVKRKSAQEYMYSTVYDRNLDKCKEKLHKRACIVLCMRESACIVLCMRETLYKCKKNSHKSACMVRRFAQECMYSRVLSIREN